MTDIPSAELLARSLTHPDAAQALFSRYVERLMRLARSRLSRKLAARIDAEDVVLSAYRSFFRRAERGEIILHQTGDLWRLLARITIRKVCRGVRRHLADCRSIEREQPWPSETDPPETAILARGPSPADAAALLDELRVLLAPLGPIQRRIVELRLDGHDIDDIAVQVQRSARTVRRTLAALGEDLERRFSEPFPLPAPVNPCGESLCYGDIILQQQLGEGGMGKVYRALLRRDNTQVAVKILRKPLRQHQTAVTRFLHEAELLGRLRHPGIVAVHGLGVLPDGGHFLVMDLVEGSDLARQLALGPISPGQALRWVAEAGEAIAYAHQQGIVHCDLKPSNLLLGHDGRIRVTDFGLARSGVALRFSGVALRSPVQKTGSLRSVATDTAGTGGTPGFMAPEQMDPAHGPISPRTDLYGLGAVLYTLLAGQPPFPADSLSMSEHREPPPALFGSLGSDIPADLVLLCRRCLAADPMSRPASAAELVAALRALRDRTS